MRNRVLVIAAASLLPLAAASAQETPSPSNVISIQPINAVVLTMFSVEYERKTGAAVSFGVGGTYWKVPDSDDVIYKSGDVKLRYYPQGVALQGFSFGGSVGFTSVEAVDPFDGTEESASGPSFGVLLEYQWLMGASRNFAVALGLGAKAIFADEKEITSDDFVVRYPTARVSVGFAF